MKKTSIKWNSLQDRIDAFQKSPIGQLKTQFKGEEQKLRKISRNRLLRRQPSLPYIYQQQKQNIQQNAVELRVIKTSDQTTRVASRESSSSKGLTRNRSFFKTKTLNIEHNNPKYPLNYQHNTPKMSLKRKSSQPQILFQQMKQNILSQQMFIRSKQTNPSRNCMSAQIKNSQNAPTQPPQKLRQFRKALHRKKSHQKAQDQSNHSQNTKQIPLLLQAQRIAYSARNRINILSYSEDGCENKCSKFFALQDFLNEWKQINLK